MLKKPKYLETQAERDSKHTDEGSSDLGMDVEGRSATRKAF